MEDQTKHYLISGRVQGVGFRMFVHSRARELGLKGWVRNLADGRVEAVARGSADQLKPFENAIRTGPSRAIVESVVTADWNQSSEFADFTVERDGAEPCS